MKREIRINFTDFHPGHEKKQNLIYLILCSRYSVIIDEVHPDYLFYSCFGYDFLKYDCIRIFYTGENVIPDFNLCDYATGYAHLQFGDRYLRYPDFAAGHYFTAMAERRRTGMNLVKKKEKFCNFIYSNGNADPERDKFYHLLSSYKKVDSAGKHLNNTELTASGKGWSADKLEFLNDYKFTIAFENSSLEGYTTEKILHAYIAETIPIYWGDPLIEAEFNPQSFINCHAFNSWEEVVKRVKEIDEDEDLYKAMLAAPLFLQNEPPYMQDGFLLNFLTFIFDQSLERAGRRVKYGYNLVYEQRLKIILSELKVFKDSAIGFKALLRKILQRIAGS